MSDGPAQRQPTGPEDVRWDAPIFVVSAGRSGSTHLTDILNCHPEVAITHESNIAHFINLTCNLARWPAAEPYEVAGFRMTGLIPSEYSDSFADAYVKGVLEAWKEFYRTYFAGRRFTRWGDKFQFPEVLPDLIRMFPDAQFVHLIRDGRDCVRSANLFHERVRQKQPGLPVMSFTDHCEYWVRVNRGIRNCLRGFDAVLEVRYEDLVLHPGEQTERVLEFLGLPLLAPPFEFIEGTSRDRFQRHGTSRDPASSIGRWQSEFTTDEKRIANEVMGRMLEELGY